MTQITPLNSQQFTKSHFHFPIILESVSCQVLLQWSELHYRFLCLSSEMMYMPHRMSTTYFNHDRIFKLVTRRGKCISMFGEYDEKWRYFGGISDLHWQLSWLLIGAQEQWSLIYRTFVVGFKNNCSGSKTVNTQKTIQNFHSEVHLLLCNRMWIYQGMNWSSSSITHHPQSFPLFSLLRWEILDNLIKRCKHCVTFQWYGNHMIEGVSKRCRLEWSINMPSCATHSCKNKILSFTSLTWQLTILLLNSCNLKNTHLVTEHPHLFLQHVLVIKWPSYMKY